MNRQMKADMAMFLVVIGWGASFILTKDALSSVSTYNFLAIRFLLAFFISFVVFIKNMKNVDVKTLKYAIILGGVLFSHFAFQTVGLNYTTASKSAFITGFNIILVPVIMSILMKKAPKKKTIISVIISFIGIGLLTLGKDVSGVNIGDAYTLVCALSFAIYIVLVEKYVKDVDSIAFAVIQIGVVGVLSLAASLMLESPVIPAMSGVWINIVILSVVCTSGAYIIQNLAQKYTPPTHIALISSAEPVFAAMFGYFLYGEVLSGNGVIGAMLILLGMIICEVDIESLVMKRREEASYKAGLQ